MIISNFSSKKVCQYLDEGRYHRVLIKFCHGLGDAIMFYNTCYKALRKKYPHIEFAYSTHYGQEELFGKVDKDPEHYDIAFSLGYPCSEWGLLDETKSEKCARVELGLTLPPEERYSLPKSFASPLVGLHFNSTSCPSFDVPLEFGKKLWEQIIDAGLIPIDTHMRHPTDNPRSIVHDFEQCRKIDNIPASLDKLIGLISVCRGFAGVPSGNLICALSLLPPEKILYLSSEFSMNRHIHFKCFEMNIKKQYDPGKVNEWLATVKKN